MLKKMRSFLVIAFLMLSTFVSAQVTTASLKGRVTDGFRDPLIGSTVKATHTPTGTVYYTITQPSGAYVFQNLRIGGPYTVEFSFIGYRTEVRTGINLALGEEITLSIEMEEDSQILSEVMVVADRNPVISSGRTGAQEIITREKMDMLPTLNRSLNDFTRLTPMSSNAGGGPNFGGVSYRFNNVTIDGASFNNSFGLSESLGAKDTEPISMESLDQIQVMIAPYDVRNGGFTGAGINSVTKSGTNDFHATAYMYTKSPSLMGYRQKDEIVDVTDFSNRSYGVSLSGPIIKNKLFLFVNGEIERRETPISYTTNNSRVNAEDLKDLSSFLDKELGYNPGIYDVKKHETYADRLTARLDWNINANNILSVKYYYLKSYNTNSPSSSGAPSLGRGPNANSIPFSSCFYRTNNNFNIFMADLNTTINPRMSNYLKFGYSRLRDYRDMDGGFFPQVDILNGNSEAYTTFGTEANSYNNKLDTDIWQIQDNFIMNLGQHQITIGTQSDYRKFKNGFAQNYPGAWVFSSINDFKFNVLATKQYLAQNNGSINGFNINNYKSEDFGLPTGLNGLANSDATGYSRYDQKYAIGESFPYAEVDVLQLGFYAQDKWTVNDKLNLTLGLRVDVPIFLTDLQENPAVAASTFRDGMKIDVSKYPNAKPLFSPRLGFNYNPFDEGFLQIRGGTGIFSGTPPYVWLSNQAGNNGLLFGDIRYEYNTNTGVDTRPNLGFTGDLNTYKPAAGEPTKSDIAVTDPDFKYPSLWKSNIAADYKFGDGWIATVEMLYSKDINAIYHDNINRKPTESFVNDGSPNPARTFYSGYVDSSSANDVILLRNTSKGYSFYTTFQLQKTFRDGIFKGLYLNGSYTMGRAKAVTDGTSSVATSAWKYRAALNPNSQELSYGLGSFNGKLLLSGSYTAEWGKNSATSFGLVYQRYRPFRYSYCYNGDANGDGQTANDLIYIPRNFEEVKDNLLAGDFKTIEEAWKAMDDFIEQDDYLRKNRGKYAERNGAVAPWANQLDVSIHHDIKVFQKNGRPHTLRFSFDIANFLNLLNKDWGVQRTTELGNQQYQFLTIPKDAPKPSADNNYTIKYTMNNKITETFKDYVSNASRWQMQFGIKYIF